MLVDLCKQYRVDFQSLKQGNILAVKPKKHMLIRAEMLQNVWALYNNKEVNAYELLEMSSNLVSQFSDHLQHTIIDYSTSMYFCLTFNLSLNNMLFLRFLIYKFKKNFFKTYKLN